MKTVKAVAPYRNQTDSENLIIILDFIPKICFCEETEIV